MITSHQRGHPVFWDSTRNLWLYVDNGSPASVDRPCAKCHKLPTPEGHDACLGYIPGAIGACCGHGVQDGYVIDESGQQRPIVSA